MPFIRFRLLTGALAAAGLAMLAFTGCRNAEPPAATSSNAGSMADTIATVNGLNITKSQLYDAMSHYIPAQLPDFPRTPMVGIPASQVALQSLIENSVVEQAASTGGAAPSQSEIDAKYADEKLIDENHMTKPFETSLAEQGYTPESFKAEVILPERARFKLMTAGMSVSDSEILAYYNSHLTEFQTQTRVHLERATFADQATAGAAYSSAVTTGSLSKYADQSLDNPTDFPQWIEIDKPQGLPAPLVTQLRAAKVGDVLKPMNLGRWWVIRIVEKQPAATRKLADVKGIISDELLQQKAQQQGKQTEFGQTIAGDLASCTVMSNQPAFKQFIVQIKQSWLRSASAATPTPGAPAPGGAAAPPH